LNGDALVTGQEMFVESVGFLFGIEMEDGAAVLQKLWYESAKIQGVIQDCYLREHRTPINCDEGLYRTFHNVLRDYKNLL
jgi:hypothetical protein